ncbi:amino acid dehydrogenase [Vandammella animalimorsus]|uniref:Amino acid dehydrogenase n=1 Tax=Vandammella animalimorsus TaxID=2029117 RepID=A0A2A2T7Z0_9BURK|nr:FAD-dependent oxidoreductase [Vandammella animalimorsus]PAX17988.1 amino acid dehydrogenase [Vandammella animalimorsus]PAX20142.1 amino acid dehydrogenase [Vandammella animalimorsus]
MQVGNSVIVLGAGMVGVCTAVQLARRGDAVVLLDRQRPGRETSYGNAGLVQREAVEPYGFPQGLLPIARAALQRGIDVRYDWTALPGLAGRLAQYWRNSTPQRYAAIVRDFGRLIEHALDEHAALLAEAGGQELVQQSGWIKAMRDERALALLQAYARQLEREWGVQSTPLDRAALQALEPGLQGGFAGGLHWTQPWAVRDPGALVQRYAQYFERLGGRILQGDAASLQPQGAGWAVQTAQGRIDAQQAVIALGPWAEPLTRRLGYRLPLFIKRGYHRHYRSQALQRPVLDADHGYMLVPMQQGLRLTTGAEFARLDSPATPVQLFKAEQVARSVVALGEPVEAQPWMGSRPCTVDMKPIVGAAPRHPGLWFHFGHAHQGFTLGPVTAQLLAQLMHGEAPLVDPAPYSPHRFRG